jgi:hypothetical protein
MTELNDANDDHEGPVAQWFMLALVAFVWIWIVLPPRAGSLV